MESITEVITASGGAVTAATAIEDTVELTAATAIGDTAVTTIRCRGWGTAIGTIWSLC